ncbi:magnesium chelatase domain-containing protein [Paenibacillus larvae]|nr:magnesium chelatase domain-containing protein [Paenibacillus larvae]
MDKIGFPQNPAAVEVVKKYATNGREAVNIIQLAAGIAMTENMEQVTAAQIEWVVNSSQISPRPERKVPPEPQIGFVNGLAVYGPNLGMLLEIEVIAIKAARPGAGIFNITGVVDEEEMGGGARTIRRKSMARGSVENVLTVLTRLGMRPKDFNLHINFPGGTPIDGPSAGISMATAIASAIYRIPVDNRLAMTGEMSIHGRVKPVGGVVAKVEAALQAGATKVLIPKENWQELFKDLPGVEVVPVDSVQEVLQLSLGLECEGIECPDDEMEPDAGIPSQLSMLHAKPNKTLES